MNYTDYLRVSLAALGTLTLAAACTKPLSESRSGINSGSNSSVNSGAGAATGPALATANPRSSTAQSGTAPVNSALPGTAEKPHVPPPPGAWGYAPAGDGPLYPALDGMCRYMKVAPIGNGDVVGYGPGTAGAPIDQGFTTLLKIRDDGFEPIPSTGKDFGGHISYVSGTYPDALFTQTMALGRSSNASNLYRLNPSTRAWDLLFAGGSNGSDDELSYSTPVRWSGGFIYSMQIAHHNEADGHSLFELRGLDLPTGTKIPPLLAGLPKSAVVFDVKSNAAGDLAVLYRDDQPTRGVRVYFAETKNVFFGRLPAIAETNGRPDYPFFARGDALQVVTGGVRYALRPGAGTALMVESVGPASGFEVRALGGGRKGIIVGSGTEEWAFSEGMAPNSGKLFRKQGAEFVAFDLPKPPYSTGAKATPEALLQGLNGEVLVLASYAEKGLGWRDPVKHRILYRSHKPSETYRCNEPDAENFNVTAGEGIQSWPAEADAACTHVFAVLARTSKQRKTTNSYEKPMAVVGAHPEWTQGAPYEFRSGDRLFLGVAVPDYATGRQLVDAASKGESLRAELVCGRPTAVRALTTTAAPRPPAHL